MTAKLGLRRRYRGLLKPADRAWHRWLKWGKPRRWGRERISRAFHRLDLVAIYMLLFILASVVSPLLLLHAVVRRPFSYRAFVLTATCFIALGVVVTFPLWTGSVEPESREVWRDRASLVYLILGTWIALAYQKRSSDLAAVRDVYDQWLEVQSRAIQAAALLGRPAVSLQQLRLARDVRADLVEHLGRRLLEQAREAQMAIQEAAHRALQVGRRASSLRLFGINDGALRVSGLLNSKLGVLVEWQQELLGMRTQVADSMDAVRERMFEVQRACEAVTKEIEAWLRG